MKPFRSKVAAPRRRGVLRRDALRRGALRRLISFAAIVTGLFAPQTANALEPCPVVACITVIGFVEDPHGNPVPDYSVGAHRNDGFTERVTTDKQGSYRLIVPIPAPNDCYKIVGTANAFHANSQAPKRVCSDAVINLAPKYRINGVSGVQKTYLGSTAQHVYVPIEVSALSRSHPAPFANDELPWLFSHEKPDAMRDATASAAHKHHGMQGVFGEPQVRKLSGGVWQYVWKQTIHLPSHEAGFYDMDWGRGTSVFNPMMDCRMIWFGYGTASLTPARALPGTIVTVTGQRLGTEPGTVVLRGGGSITRISDASIIEWTPDRVQFLLPPGAKSGWVTLVPPTGVTTNGQPITVGA